MQVQCSTQQITVGLHQPITAEPGLGGKSNDENKESLPKQNKTTISDNKLSEGYNKKINKFT